MQKRFKMPDAQEHSREPVIIGANEGDPCPLCGQPLKAVHFCSEMIESVDENGNPTYLVKSVMVPEGFTPRRMVKIQ